VQCRKGGGGHRPDYYTLGPISRVGRGKVRRCKGSCVFDAEAPVVGEIVFCLLMIEACSQSYEYTWTILVLQPHGNEGHIFLRIGVGFISDSFVSSESSVEVEFFDEMEEKVVTLV